MTLEAIEGNNQSFIDMAVAKLAVAIGLHALKMIGKGPLK
uniref:Uncharacterized protein n=1 Tax=Manihot esculenta TaxID=3983 RepID=A0A2C9UU00_MANES